jgi:hypothetical protein
MTTCCWRRSGLRPLDTIADDILHEFDEDREDIPDLRAIPRVILQPFTQRIAHGKQDVLRHITRIAEDKFVPQRQLAEFKKSVKLHHNAG